MMTLSLPISPHRMRILLIGLLVLFTPVILLVITIGFLLMAQSIVLNELSALEMLELYLIEVAIFGGFAYLLYRTTQTVVEEHLPASLDATEEPREADDSSESNVDKSG